MALRHKWLDAAQTELDATVDYVFLEFGDRVANRVYVEIMTCVERLTLYPDLGLRYKDLFYKGNEVKIFHLKKSSIIYCHDKETVYILSLKNNYHDSGIRDLLSRR